MYSKLIRINLLLIIFIVLSLTVSSQEVRWKRSAAEEIDLQLFHSLYSINLPTAETLQRGDFLIGIAHRFRLPVTNGISDLWGIDGSIYNRFEVGYAPLDKMVAIIGRTNFDGNIDLQIRYKAIQIENEFIPTLITSNIGVAYNGKANPEPEKSSKKFQYFVQAIINTMLFEKTIAFGIVPSYVYNSNIYCDCPQYSLTTGGYAQYYISPMWSVLTEFNSTVIGLKNKHNSFALAIELETAGHFFKVQLGTSVFMNMTRYLTGSLDGFSSGDWHLGFNITRTL